jgi:hypothetical protein
VGPADRNGEAYQNFRARYRRGEVAECRTCPWKTAYLPGPLRSEIIASRGLSAQLLHGWHAPSSEEHIWSSQQAAAVLLRPGSRTLHVCGMLPPGPEGDFNELTIDVNGIRTGRVENPWDEVIPFGLDFDVADGQAPWMIEFRTRHVFRPSERRTGSDQRDLGFALVLLVSKDCVSAETTSLRETETATAC